MSKKKMLVLLSKKMYVKTNSFKELYFTHIPKFDNMSITITPINTNPIEDVIRVQDQGEE